MEKKIETILILLCCCVFCAAQQVVSSGGYTMKSEYSVNWILGGSLADIPAIDQSTLNKFKKEHLMELMESESSIKVYPSPVTDFINIEITPADTGRYMLELCNNSGVKILSKSVVYQPLLQVNFQDIPSGIYYLRVLKPSSSNQLLKVEKIIKL